jgi:transmembrane sensor
MNRKGLHSRNTAAHWVARLHSDQATAGDKAEFEAWRTEEAVNAEEFAAHNEIWHAVGALANRPEARAILLRSGRSSTLNVSRRYWLGAAASAAAGVALWALPRVRARTEEFRSGRGEHRTVALDDGSTATLNTDSIVQVSMRRTERCLLLKKGQCFVDVAKDPARPFRVFAGGHEIRALGTAFDVYKDGDTVQVTMTHGKVAIYDAAPAAPEFSFYEQIVGIPLDQKNVSAVVSAGKQAIIAPSSRIQVVDVDVRRTEAWRVGQIIFDETPLSDAVRDVNRYATRQIVLGDPSLAQLKVSGVFQISHLDQFGQALADSFELRAQDRGNSVTILPVQ